MSFQIRAGKLVISPKESTPHPTTLGVREHELRSAMRELGVEDVRFLGYRDSGMARASENEHHDAIAQASNEDVAWRIRQVIDDFKPTILITSGPEGVYLLPDHVSVHHGSMLAIQIAAGDSAAHRPSCLILAAMPREIYLEAWNEPGNIFEDVPYETILQWGTPGNEITHHVDVSGQLTQKRTALGRH